MNSKNTKLDEIDRKLMFELVRNSNRSYRTLAKAVGMSPAATIERVRALENGGYITGYGARFDYLLLGYEFMAVVEINISAKDILEVENNIAKLNHVAAVWDSTGQYDAIGIVMCKSRGDLSATVKKILAVKGVEKTNTSVVLNVVKRLTEFDGV
ncbi:Lrp/AsnC family transcriptional regulator [Candidatus Micrarchaeota archaeon]|nr:Lrp/AsnC family transcriptional regulator [Candidatus Micrarchaeota archaeon]